MSSDDNKQSDSKQNGSTKTRSFSLSGLLKSPAFQLAVYFIAVGLLLALLADLFPPIRQLYLPDAPPVGDVSDFGDIGDIDGGDPQWTSLAEAVTETAVLGVLALLGALIFAVPVVRIYVVTMRQEGYEKSFVRLLVALPVVVSGVVRIVQNDLALAFALAGIVAAVRFRTTVKDLQDAFFAFAAIGIGLATGTGNFVMAGAASVVLCALVYGMWRLDVGEIGHSLELPYGGVSLSAALVPGESQEAVVLGEREVLPTVGPTDLDELQESINQLAGYVRADALRKKKKYNTLIIAHVDPESIKSVRKEIEETLMNHASRCVCVGDIALENSDTIAIQFLARLKKSVDIGAMVEAFDYGPKGPIYALELKPIGGLRDRIT